MIKINTTCVKYVLTTVCHLSPETAHKRLNLGKSVNVDKPQHVTDEHQADQIIGHAWVAQTSRPGSPAYTPRLLRILYTA